MNLSSETRQQNQFFQMLRLMQHQRGMAIGMLEAGQTHTAVVGHWDVIFRQSHDFHNITKSLDP